MFSILSLNDAPFPHKCCSCGTPYENTDPQRFCIPFGYPVDAELSPFRDLDDPNIPFHGVPSICVNCFISAMNDTKLGMTREAVETFIEENTPEAPEVDLVPLTAKLREMRNELNSVLGTLPESGRTVDSPAGGLLSVQPEPDEAADEDAGSSEPNLSKPVRKSNKTSDGIDGVISF